MNRIVSAIKLGTLCLALAGCATDRNQPAAAAAVADGAEVVTVFYGTNRSRRVGEESRWFLNKVPLSCSALVLGAELALIATNFDYAFNLHQILHLQQLP